MATTIEVDVQLTGLSLIADLYRDGISERVAAITLVESSSLNGYYSGTVALAPGLYFARIHQAGNPLGDWWLQIPSSGRCVAEESRSLAQVTGLSDPLQNPVPGTYPPQSAGWKLGHLGTAADIANQLRGAVELADDVLLGEGTELKIVRGDDYRLADGRDKRLTVSGTFPDLSGATVRFQVDQCPQNPPPAQPLVIESPGTLEGLPNLQAPMTIIVHGELTAQQTRVLQPGTAQARFILRLANGDEWTMPTEAIPVQVIDRP